MDDRILINPENRMLGTSGSNDFSLYGAQPDPALTIGPAPPEEVSETIPPAGPEADPLHTDIPAAAPSASDVPEAPAQAAPAPSGVFAGSPQAASSAPAATSESGGSITPAPPAAPLAGFDGNALTAPTLAAPGSGTPLADSATVASVPAPLFEAVDASPSAAAPAVAASVSPLAEAVSLGTAEQVLPELIAEILPADPLAPVAEGAQDLLGADPAGGIATLVSLVSISDVLDLGAVVTEGADTPADPAADLIDMLAIDSTGESAPPALEEGEDDGADALLAMPLPPPDDPLDDTLGL